MELLWSERERWRERKRESKDYLLGHFTGTVAWQRLTALSDDWQVSFEMPVKQLLFRLLKCIFGALIIKAWMAQIGAVNIANGSRIIHCQCCGKDWWGGEVWLFCSHNGRVLNDSSPPWQRHVPTSGASGGWHRSGQVLEQDHTSGSHFNF